MTMKLDELKNVLSAQMRRSEIVANNLANVNATGFKRDVMFFDVLHSKSDSELRVDVETDFSQGSIQLTDNPMDLAISGKGFFLVEDEQGPVITRNGHFTLDANGFLRSATGKPVLGEGGWINLSLNGQDARNIKISNTAEIYVDEEYIDRLRIVEMEENATLQKAEGTAFRVDPASIRDIENPVVLQGRLERSNVNAVEEMVAMIEMERQFESTQKVVRMLDDTLRQTVNRVGKFR